MVLEMKKQSKLIIATTLLIAVCSSVFAMTFSDITEEHWAYKYVSELTNANVIAGYPDGTYKPEGTISKAEFLKLSIAASLPEGVTIDDVPSALNSWIGPYLYLAETYGIVNKGEITLENMNEPITRREMVSIISKADIMLKFNEFPENFIVTYFDCDSMNREELSWLNHAISNGYITGYPDNTFKPENNMTRAEAATVIHRYLNGGEVVSE